jgi:hypothetical protein
MQTVTIPLFRLESIIDSLNDTLNVCRAVNYQSDNHEETAPYALGYSKAGLQLVVDQLKGYATTQSGTDTL